MPKNTRKCKFAQCGHDSKDIDITAEPFIKNGSGYYHQDCFEQKERIKNQRKCQFSHCKHDNPMIDLLSEPYIEDNSKYYHKDCYREKQCLQEIRQLWHERISDTVVYKDLNTIVSNLAYRDGIEIEYVLFAIKYCVTTGRFKLRYPAGIKYILDREEVKQAYKATKIPQVNIHTNFKVDQEEDELPKFSMTNKRRRTGFGQIFGGDKK